MIENLVEFFKKRPELQKKYVYSGTFKDFSADIAKTVRPVQGRTIMREAIIKEANRLLDFKLSMEELDKQLSFYPIISTADHHGLLNYKLLYNSNILYSRIINELNLPFMVVLSSGSIPLNNISHPRGFYFKNRKFNFFGEKQSKLPMYLFNKKLTANRENGIDSFLISYDKNNLTNEERKFLEFLFFDCLQIEKTENEHETFSDQLTFLNYKLWKFYFEKNIRNEIPDIIYLQANSILLDVLVSEIKNEDSIIPKILFDKEVRKIYLQNFFGLPGCWGQDMGSHFFWGIIERKKKIRFTRLQLDESSNSLIGENFNILLQKEIIIDALISKKIVPTLFFDILIVTFLESYLALGGLNQIEYLPKMQKAHVDCLNEIGLKDMASRFEIPLSGGLICGMHPFGFNSGIDLLWHYNSTENKFNGNMDGGLKKSDLNNMSNMLFTELLATGIDTTLGIG